MKIGEVVFLRSEPEVRMTVSAERWERGKLAELQCCWFDAGLRIRASWFLVEMLGVEDSRQTMGFGDTK